MCRAPKEPFLLTPPGCPLLQRSRLTREIGSGICDRTVRGQAPGGPPDPLPHRPFTSVLRPSQSFKAHGAIPGSGRSPRQPRAILASAASMCLSTFARWLMLTTCPTSEASMQRLLLLLFFLSAWEPRLRPWHRRHRTRALKAHPRLLQRRASDSSVDVFLFRSVGDPARIDVLRARSWLPRPSRHRLRPRKRRRRTC